MDDFDGGQLSGVWQVVVDLEDMTREVRRLVTDLAALHGIERSRSLDGLTTDLEVAAADLRRSLENPIDFPKVGSILILIRRQSLAAADEVRVATPEIPSAQKLIRARYQKLQRSLDSLPADLFPQLGDEAPDQAWAQTTVQVGTEIHEIRIRAQLEKSNTVLIVDGDRVALEGWPDLSVIARRDAMLVLLATVKAKAHIAVMLDRSVGGLEAVAPTDGIQVLLTNPAAQLRNAMLALVSTQSPESSVLLVADDSALLTAARKLHGDVSGASVLALLRLLAEH